MRTKTLIKFVAGAAVLVGFVVLIWGPSVVAQESEGSSVSGQKWEYRVLVIREQRRGNAPEVQAWQKTSEKQLNEVGALGWELVDTREARTGSDHTVLYLKRPRS